MRSANQGKTVHAAAAALAALLSSSAALAAPVSVSLSAQRMTAPQRDGTPVPMWGFCATAPAAGQPGCGPAWAPGPTITAVSGDSLSITLTNNLPVPTSLVILGQAGGGLGAPSKMEGPEHKGQVFSTFPGNAPAPFPFVPPAQGKRVRSFGAEVAAGQTATLTWQSLKPGTYLYETGTMPSLQVPMGLYGVLVVTEATASYNGKAYDDQATLLFSEIDVVQNKAVDAAATAGVDPNLRFNHPSCIGHCYPAAVNYAPTYFLINGRYFDRTAPENSALYVGNSPVAPATNGVPYQSGNVLVRLVNAGSRTHIPSIVGLPMAILGEDGNAAPGLPKIQNEVLLTASKTHDVLVNLAAGIGSFNGYFAAGTYPIFDRQLSLSTANHSDGGMLSFLLVNNAGAKADAADTGSLNYGATSGVPGMLPAALAVAANNDSFNVPCNATYYGNVTTNDVGVSRVALVGSPANADGTFTISSTLGNGVLRPDGSFTYTPAACAQATDSFTYAANGNAALSATVSLNIASMGIGLAPTVRDAAFTSSVAGRFSTTQPGLLAYASDPTGYPLTVALVTGTGNTCDSVTVNPDGSFVVTNAAASCQFLYSATNSQGTLGVNAASPAINTATATISFGTSSANVAGPTVSVVDADDGTPIADYRWTLQEDLTFKHATGATPAVNTRTVGTSFHRSHMPVVATGCTGDVSCGAGQAVGGVAVPLCSVSPAAVPCQKSPTSVASVMLDPTRHYYLSILPGDAADPVLGNPFGHAMGGAEIKIASSGTSSAAQPLTIKIQKTPLPTAQMSIYVYEDNQPTNGQFDQTEAGLGGFNIILVDPAGRTGDPAGQQTYDAFNMPLSNALLGRPGCPDDRNKNTNGTGTSEAGNFVGVVYTCPNAPPDFDPADTTTYALAGHALIKNLTPARYDVIAHPGADRSGAGEVWWQVETLEGTPAQDAFVGINEPQYFQEFGPPGPHVTIGFVSPTNVDAYRSANSLGGPNTISGKITSQHMSHPVDVRTYSAGTNDLLSSTTCQVVLNSQGGNGPAVAWAQCDASGRFQIQDVPPGDYDIAVFDQWLDQIIQNISITVPAGSVNQDIKVFDGADIPVLSWFMQYDQNIFLDTNKNGVYDPGEPGISNVPLSVRYRNGAPSNSTLTDSNGNGLLVELFPLFNWYVAEADTTRFKQTGVTIVVDSGGPVDQAPGQAVCGKNKDQPCPDGTNLWSSTYPTGEQSARTEVPGALNYGLQGFISQRSRVDWGRTPYAVNENGGIAGTVVYSSTRPFDDMRFNVQTLWEPLVPRVQMNLYKKATLADGTETLQLVDSTQTTSFDDYVNRVYGADGAQYLLGPDGTLRDDAGNAALAGAYPAGRQVNMRCPGQIGTDPFVTSTLAIDSGHTDLTRCYDGFHNWNQVQAAPYDGRYQFPSADYIARHPLCKAGETPETTNPACTTPTTDQTLVSLPIGKYVVEAVTPPGYEIVKEEDKNILIGDAFVAPASQQFGALANIFILPDQATLGNANPNNPNTGDPGFQSNPTTDLGVTDVSQGVTFPECVGKLHRVPDFLSLYPAARQVAPFAGMDRPLCDRKLVVLNDQMQASATFFVFTETPVASNNTGIILDDASAEFNATSPDFGEKASVPFVPVSIKDFRGNEVIRTYSDQWGAYNMMTPSSWLVNPPTPSGYGPNMLIACINDPGPLADGKVDPAYNPSYSNFCYTNPYMPGQTTYLDTPLLPVASFASGYNAPDCALPDATPAISRVDGAGIGPWLPSAGGTLRITALGDQEVPNPAYAGPFGSSGPAAAKSLTRHYNFGDSPGRVMIGSTDVTAGVVWSRDALTVTVPAGTSSGQLVITNANGTSSVDAVTVTLEDKTPTVLSPAQGAIQAAVDAATPGDLIILDAGTYNELVILWKPVRLQGVGAASVIINAAKYPTSKLDAWRPRINALFGVDIRTGNVVGTPQVDPLPTQEITGGVVLLEPSVLGTEEGAGITVLAKNLTLADCFANPDTTTGFASNFNCAESRIDGLSVTGGDSGGGIYVNGWAHHLEIANNRVYGNAGAFNGGIRVGVPYLELEALPPALDPATNRISGFGYDVGLKIHHNEVTKNGTVEGPGANGGAGGGVSICTGTDNYSIDHNFICGNFTTSDGGGIGHLGFSQGGTIAFNQVLFNQSFQQTTLTHGGGIIVAGEPAVAGAVSLGTGDVTIDANQVRGNFAGSGHGGGIRLQQVNGADVSRYSAAPERWNRVTLTNNMVVNNVAAYAGGGLALVDALNVIFDNNTVASNDSAGIAGTVIAGNAPSTGTVTAPNLLHGQPSPAGVVAEPTNQALRTQMAPALRATYSVSKPREMENNILLKNRSFFYSGDGRICAANARVGQGWTAAQCVVVSDQSSTGECPGNAAYWDLGVLGDTSVSASPTPLSPTYSILTQIGIYGGVGNLGGVDETNLFATPMYCNGSRVPPEFAGGLATPATANLQVAATVDEGNNYVSLKYGPLYLDGAVPSVRTGFGNYHLGGPVLDGGRVVGSSSPAYNAGTNVGSVPTHDYDGEPRPIKLVYDIGADEFLTIMPIRMVSPTSLPFGPVSINTSMTLTVTVSNGAAATENLLLSPPMITGGNSTGRYTLEPASTCTYGAPGLAAGAACVVSVTFSPTAITPAPQTASLVINASNALPFAVPLSGTGVLPRYRITPVSRNFGNQQAGTQSDPTVFTVTNTSNNGGEVWFTGGPLVTGTFASSFPAQYASAAQGGCTPSTHLAPNASCTVLVSFAPTAVGAAGTAAATPGALVNVSLTAGAVGQAVPVWGTGSAPRSTLQATVATADRSFGAQQQFTTSAPHGFTFTNAGTGPFTVSAIGLSDTTNFQLVNNTCTLGITLQAGASCTVGVTFTPTVASAANGLTSTLTATGTSGAAGTSSALVMQGRGVAPSSSMTPSSSAYGGVQVGTTKTNTFTFANAGSGPITVTGSSFANPSNKYAVVTNGCTSGLVLAAAGSCQITIGLSPTAASATVLSASITVTAASGAATTQASSSLTGTGIGPTATLSPSPVAFGQQQVGATSAEHVFQLNNTGPGPFTITTFTFNNTSGAYAVTSNGCAVGTVVNSLANCKVNVTFRPAATSAAGALTASLSLAGSSGGVSTGTLTASLTGQGVAPNPTLAGANTFNAANPSRTLTLTNPNPAVGNAAPFLITAISVAPQGTSGNTFRVNAGGTCAVGTNLAAAGSCTVIVVFNRQTPVPPAGVAGTLTVSGTGPAGVTAVPSTYTATRALTGN